MNQTDLLNEVHEIISGRLARREVVDAGWLTMEVVNLHDQILGDDTDFYRLCAFGHVRATVRNALRKYAASLENEQLDLPTMEGFKRLRTTYLVERDDDHGQVVPIEQLTIEELYAKAAEYKRMGHACLEHAEELLRYAMTRLEPTPAAVL